MFKRGNSKLCFSPMRWVTKTLLLLRPPLLHFRTLCCLTSHKVGPRWCNRTVHPNSMSRFSCVVDKYRKETYKTASSGRWRWLFFSYFFLSLSHILSPHDTQDSSLLLSRTLCDVTQVTDDLIPLTKCWPLPLPFSTFKSQCEF